MQYHAKNVGPSSAELRAAQRTLAEGAKQDLQFDFVTLPDADPQLYSQRVDYLQSHLGQGLKVPESLALAKTVPVNAVGLAAVQLVDVTPTRAVLASQPTAK